LQTHAMATAKPVSANRLQEMLTEARTRTLGLVADLSDHQMMGPQLSIVNPPLWEIGHVAWFQEKWALRHLRGLAPIRPDGDSLYDSAAVPHDNRWQLPLPSREETLAYMDEVLSRCRDRLSGAAGPEETYFHLLPIYHEYMHAEAIGYTRQTLSYAQPQLNDSSSGGTPSPGAEGDVDVGGGPLTGDVEVPGGVYMLGAAPEAPFAFDNEKWAHPGDVQTFRIARAPVTNGEFAEFVEAGGYRNERWWDERGLEWLRQTGAQHPVYWEPVMGGWLQRVFDKRVPLPEHLPVIHVNWFEAKAYCGWAGRRLPTEAEWEMAASTEPDAVSRADGHRRTFPWGNEPPAERTANLDWHAGGLLEVGALPGSDSAYGCRQMIGNVWEWVEDDFGPYPGFVVDPYKEYSAPWFGNHKVLRGGCWTTRSQLIRNTWRNFYTPDRRDVWSGFRTAR
jgi:iron(II)-dependent oxidoreductase